MHLDECWDMTINEVIEKNNLTTTNNHNSSGILSQISYLSEMFGKQTFGSLTKQFINQYSKLIAQQLNINRNIELSKSKLITDFICFMPFTIV